MGFQLVDGASELLGDVDGAVAEGEPGAGGGGVAGEVLRPWFPVKSVVGAPEPVVDGIVGGR